MILFISYHHWDSEVPASIRSRRLASELNSLGYRVDILAGDLEVKEFTDEADIDPGSYISSPARQKDLLKAREAKKKTYRGSKLISKLLSLVFCDTGWKWSISVGKLLFSKPFRHRYTLVLVSGRPFLVFLAVYAYAVSYGKRYILDYRDSWLQNPATAWYSRFFRPFLRIMERLVVKRASGVFSASRSISESLGFNDPENVQYIYPSLDYSQRLQQLYSWQPPLKGSTDLVLAYTGSVFKVNSLAPICKAIASLDKSNAAKLEFHYYGPNSSLVRKEFIAHKIIHLLYDHGLVPKDNALKALSNADIAICTSYSLLREPSKMELGLVTTKVFDYILIGIPTIVISPSGSELRSILAELKSPRLRIFKPCETMAIANTLRYLSEQRREFRSRQSTSHRQRVLSVLSMRVTTNISRLERLVEAGINRNQT